ncbi:MAG: mercuric transport protein MerTP [Balneolaceae bacterium]|nr:mercuric transport protein MerTP [Balneolaceae bacterium]MBO6546298.1 mercuric transport protein MerTP [Balneolaceae bacterium]MBO6648657.1 mercuric transport protein MerTP [Balneolaceae bacterium]
MKEPNLNNDKTLMGTGIAAAFIASLCCITPVTASLAGIGGIASTFSWMEPVRPYLIGLTILILGFAWFQKLKPKSQEEIDCACEDDPSFFQSKGFLGLITLLATMLMAFPYYSDAFFSNDNAQIVYVQESNVQTIIYDIVGMTCTGCEATVNNAAQQVEGVLEVKASYETQTATISFDKSKVQPEQIKQAINKTGFTVKEEISK